MAGAKYITCPAAYDGMKAGTVTIQRGRGESKPMISNKVIDYLGKLLKMADNGIYNISFYHRHGREMISTRSRAKMSTDGHWVVDNNDLRLVDTYTVNQRETGKAHVRIYFVGAEWLDDP